MNIAGMSESKIEEIIMLLTFILCFLAYQNEFIVIAYMLLFKGSLDLLCVIYCAYKTIRKKTII